MLFPRCDFTLNVVSVMDHRQLLVVGIVWLSMIKAEHMLGVCIFLSASTY